MAVKELKAPDLFLLDIGIDNFRKETMKLKLKNVMKKYFVKNSGSKSRCNIYNSQAHINNALADRL